MTAINQRAQLWWLGVDYRNATPFHAAGNHFPGSTGVSSAELSRFMLRLQHRFGMRRVAQGLYVKRASHSWP